MWLHSAYYGFWKRKSSEVDKLHVQGSINRTGVWLRDCACLIYVQRSLIPNIREKTNENSINKGSKVRMRLRNLLKESPEGVKSSVCAVWHRPQTQRKMEKSPPGQAQENNKAFLWSTWGCWHHVQKCPPQLSPSRYIQPEHCFPTEIFPTKPVSLLSYI